MVSKRHLIWWIGMLCLLLGVLPVSAQSRSVYWERWDVTIDQVDTEENRFRVTEEYDISFSGTFRFGSAAIPLNRLDDIDDVAVYEDGELLRETRSCTDAAGTYCVFIEDGFLNITYNFFRSLTNTRQTFTIEYTVYGAIRVYEGGDQLWWDAIPEEHYGFPIGASTVTVELPRGFAPREGIDPVESYGVPADITVRGTTITAVATQPLDGDDTFSLRVQYPHDPNAEAAAWQSDFDTQRIYEETTQPLISLGVIALSLLIGIGLPLFIYVQYLNRGRDPKIGVVPEYLNSPPSDLPPALVGTLVDEKADLRDVMSTIIDLGSRGYLAIEETKTQGLMGIGSASSFTFKRTDKAIDGPELRPYEKRLLNNLFAGNALERSLDSLKTIFYTVIAQMQADLYTQLVQEGYFKSNPNNTRGGWYILGVALLFVAGFGFFAAMGAMDISPFLFCIPLAVGLGGIAAFVAAPAMPSRTLKGAEESAKWKAFVEYLRNLEKYGDVGSAAAHFDQYLAYAVAAGIDRTWVSRFRQTNTYVPIPTWYFPTYIGRYRGGFRAGSPLPGAQMVDFGRGGLPGDLARAGGGFDLDNVAGGISEGLESISSGLTNMLESAGRIMTSTPQPPPGSSGGGYSSGRWSSGGRSFSGGGSRSGGGSGGGRRGFG